MTELFGVLLIPILSSLLAFFPLLFLLFLLLLLSLSDTGSFYLFQCSKIFTMAYRHYMSLIWPLDSLLFLEHMKHTLTIGSFYLPFHLPKLFFSHIYTWVPSFPLHFLYKYHHNSIYNSTVPITLYLLALLTFFHNINT